MPFSNDAVAAESRLGSDSHVHMVVKCLHSFVPADSLRIAVAQSTWIKQEDNRGITVKYYGEERLKR